MIFEERYVLVGGRVKDDIWKVAREGLIDCSTLPNVYESLSYGIASTGRGIVEMGLIVVKQHQVQRIVTSHLAGDFRPDGSTRTRDENPPPSNECLHRTEVGLNLMPTEKIIDAQVTEITRRATSYAFSGGWQHLQREAGTLGGIGGPPDKLRIRWSDRQQCLMDAVLFG
jgi:hypothetical protein